MPARLAVARWAVRMFRREWRQQLAVIGLVTFVVSVAVFGVATTYNVVSTSDARFGTATHRLLVPGGVDLARQVEVLRERFGIAEVIPERQVHVSSSTTPLELRAQAANGRYGKPMLTLRQGRYPTTASEVALTDAWLQRLDTHIGGHIVVEDSQLSVVGSVENPADLDDEFALVAPAALAEADRYVVLLSTTSEPATDLPADFKADSIDRRPKCHATLVCLSSGQSEQATAGAAALGLATLLMLLVALMAAASFTVIAQRRLRQLGLLAANGARPRHLRLVVMLNGAIVGAIAAIVGTAVGTALWLVFAPAFENAAGHRIDRFHLPAALIVVAMALAVMTSTWASRGPARRMARVPIVSALSGRPSAPRNAHRSLLLGLGLIIGGTLALSRAIDIHADRVTPLMLVGGIVGLVVGIVYIAPSVLVGLGCAARFAPVAGRIALRDLARYRARSATALAAMSLALAIPIAMVVLAGAATHTAGEGNLSNRQLIVRIGDDPHLVPKLSSRQLTVLGSNIASFADGAGAMATPLSAVIDPSQTVTRGTERLQATVILGRNAGDTIRDVDVIYVATSPVAELLSIPEPALNGESDVLTAVAGDLAFANVRTDDTPKVTPIDAQIYSSMPKAFLTDAALQRHGWSATAAGWLIDARRPFTTEQLQRIRQVATAYGLTVESRDDQRSLATTKTAATVAGFLVALAILTLSLGLLRSETSTQERVLAANGASQRQRRALSAVTSAALAGMASALGLLIAYLGISAGYASDTAKLTAVPVVHLAILVIALPVTAAAASWLLAGGRPVKNLAHTRLE